MREKILAKIYHFALKQGKTLLIATAILTAVMAIFIPSLKISSSHQDLIPPDDPEQAKYLKYMKEFGSADNLVVVLEGKDIDDLKKSAELFSEGFQGEKKWVKSIFYKVDTTAVMQSAPLFVPKEQLKSGLEILKNNAGELQKINGTNDMVKLIDLAVHAAKSPKFAENPEISKQLLSAMTAFFNEWNEWITNPRHDKLKIQDKIFVPGSDIDYMVKSGGYLFSRDYKMLFLFVQPTSSSDDMSYLRPFIKSMRETCARVLQQNPELKDKVSYHFTGMPAHVHTETETIEQDVTHAAILAVFIVALIMIVGFRSLRATIIGIVPILAGLVITLGIISLVIGRLNLISSAMLAVMYGIGIDFSIYLIQRTEEELGNGRTLDEAVYQSVVATSRSIVTGGITTSAAFYAIGFSQFVGYSELGVTAGTGILVMMVCAFLLLPPLLFLFPVKPRYYDLNKTMEAAANPKRRKLMRIAVIAGSCFIIVGIIAAFFVRMDYNALKLLPRDTESTTYQNRMDETSDYKMSFAAVTNKDLNELGKVVDRMKNLPTVSRVQWLGDVIPTQQEEKLKVFEGYKKYIRQIKIAPNSNARTSADYIAALRRLQSLFEDSQEKAFSGGRSDIVAMLDKAIASINQITEKLADNNALALTRTHDFENAIFGGVVKAVDLIRSWQNLKPINEQNIPASFTKRFKSPAGTYVAYVFPKGSIWDVKFLDKFVAELKSITQQVTGFSLTHRVYIRLAVTAIAKALVLSLIIVMILLFIDFRRPAIVLLALLPLGFALIWLQSTLLLFRIDYNVANIAGLPLLLGLGVVYGVRIVHRWQESPETTAFKAVRTTGKGVLFAAIATLSGIFSILFARHRGVSDFGKILFLGLTLCLIAALIVLPSIIDLFFVKSGKRTIEVEAEEEPSVEIPVKTKKKAPAKKSSAKKVTKKKAPAHDMN